jgi:superfamily II DNA or RNA helicase
MHLRKRKLQDDVTTIVKGVVGGSLVDTIFVHGHCGGGKSFCPPLSINELRDYGLNLMTMWVVPRTALREQAVGNYESLGLRLNVVAGPETKPSRNADGFVCTYDSVRRNWEIYRDELERNPYMLVLDEFHHIYVGKSDDEDSIGLASVKPLFNLAKLNLLMSGSWNRHDGNQIGCMPYYHNLQGEYEPVTLDNQEYCLAETQRFVRYSRRDALAERAILPLKFFHFDGEVQWYDNSAEKQVHKLSDCGPNRKAGLFTALDTDYAKKLLHNCLDHWHGHRVGQLLVVCKGIKYATAMAEMIRERNFNCGISTTEHDPKDEAIADFKRGVTDVLVTVGKAYEGLDVPKVTHICALTHIRSRPWIEQMLNRCTRVCEFYGPYQHQSGYAFVPDDQEMRSIIEEIRREQVDALQWPEDHESRQYASERAENGRWAPIGSAITAKRVTWLDDRTQEYLRLALERGVSEENAIGLLIDWGLVDPEEVLGSGFEITESQEKTLLRSHLQRLINSICKERGYDYKTFNWDLKKRFGERDAMSLEQLRDLWGYLQEQYCAVNHA